ncbi:heme o synthase [Crocosphaera watsonii WH 8501]|uniref:Protoheme IX farnesyltransferase n=7 Tax=Crocosphaera TaxID=263510 RepID=Q4CAM7_CROWT|nr:MULTISPECIES: heme o synthase [Crocosphaera]EAM52909.1 Protoheme IX farnesyltransferase [Crocosphaera watsonii WH 8501]EHJ15176.1 Heme O synthase, protoheme IX farnesyltransferase COX10-CtaB [Crocosphaera watsonii WH 0003]MCH2244675.1 heme o synthase [Crocosphaera sp.]CCQ50189.1 Heme O synthase, protoheme IX farnesyltransferase COX10-CtaB [Crocosphaera watsonii WH 8502]CCQ56908.1 Heme O synthase, protoheme IX farnesyltransferase COX10-CtaB [Crocosphaera watsonii WH 0005]
MIGTDLVRRNENLLQVVRSYYQLTKPRIIPLLLITTAASMWMASKGEVDSFKLFITLLGGTLAAASAQVMNCIYDRDIDYEMLRTRTRPIPSGRVQSSHALIFAVVLGVMSFSLFLAYINLLSGLLAMSGIVFYMLVYTHFLKRNTPQNIVIGGAAGSIPPLVGWAAVTGDLSWAPWILFAIIFLWTPPHFWALALMIKDDYAQVNVPMMPVIEGEESTVRQIWWYTLLVIPCTLLLVYPVGASGWLYGAIAILLGAIFIKKTWLLKQNPFDKDMAKSLFKFSILYLMLLCTAMVVDSLPLTREVFMVIINFVS